MSTSLSFPSLSSPKAPETASAMARTLGLLRHEVEDFESWSFMEQTLLITDAVRFLKDRPDGTEPRRFSDYVEFAVGPAGARPQWNWRDYLAHVTERLRRDLNRDYRDSRRAT